MVRNNVHNAFLNTYFCYGSFSTTGTAFPRVTPRNEPWCIAAAAIKQDLFFCLTLEFQRASLWGIPRHLPFNGGKLSATGARLFLEQFGNVAPQQKPGTPGKCGVVDEQHEQQKRRVDDWSPQQCAQQRHLASFFARAHQSKSGQWTSAHLLAKTSSTALTIRDR